VAVGEGKALNVGPSGIEVACERFGDPGRPRRTVRASSTGRSGRSVVGPSGDVMADVSGGRATAETIPGAGLVIMDGMGRSLAHQLWPEIATRIAELVHRAEANLLTT
jgi:hypothetical protein